MTNLAQKSPPISENTAASEPPSMFAVDNACRLPARVRAVLVGGLLVCALTGVRQSARGEATAIRIDSVDTPTVPAATSLSGPHESDPRASDEKTLRLLVEALFPNQAMIRVNGKRHLLRVGEPGAHGIVLVSATADGAEVEVNGVRQTLEIGRRIAANYAPPPQGVIVRLAPGADGLYRSQGAINGVGTEMLIDTGASSVALNRTLATRIGLAFENDRQKVRVETAAGPAVAWQVTLERLRVGRIEQQDVPALVIDADSPTSVLIGSSFLEGVDIRREGQIMTLEQK